MHDHEHKGAGLVQITGLELKTPAIQPKREPKPADHNTKFLVGLDVGSTTVKAVVVDAATDIVQRNRPFQHQRRVRGMRRQ